MDTQRTDPVVFNPFEPGYFDDPYAQYALLRDHDPVHRSLIGIHMLFRYADVAPLLHDPAQSADFRKATPTPELEAFASGLDARAERERTSMLGLDPPDHTRLRKLVSKAFTPRMVEALRPRVQALVDEALDTVEPRGEMDVIGDLAFPLPFTVISEMLGMPMARRDDLRAWSGAMVKTLDPILAPDEVTAAFDAADAMRAHVTDVIAWKRDNPSDDLLSGMIEAEDAGDKLTSEELVQQVILLYVAGHETTVNLIGNGTYALLRNRVQAERLRDDPSIVAGAVEELLRYDSPVQFSRRILLRPLRIGEAELPEGSIVMTGLGAANRDPAFWGEDADVLDVTRPNANKHVSFGGGVHYCLGAALARIEGQAAIGTLVGRFPALELRDDTPDWNGRINLRGLATLPVTLG